MNLAELLAQQAAVRPDQDALVDVRGKDRRAISFAELERAAVRTAGLLQRAGLQPGDAVLVFQPMSIELYVALAAIFRSGLVAMFLDPSSGRQHIEQCCAMWPPKGLIACPKAHLLRFVSPALRRIPIQFSVGISLPWARSFTHSREIGIEQKVEECNSNTPALVTYTSGSTGQPKAALRTQGFLLNQQNVLQRALQLQPGEVDFTTMPTFALANLANGVTTVISGVDLRSPKGGPPERVLRQITEQRADRIGAAPAYLARLTEFCRSQGLSLPSLKKVYTGGGPVFPKLLLQLSKVAPNARISAIYGCTEAEPIALLERSEISKDDQNAMANGGGLLAGQIDRAIDLRIIRDCVGQSQGPFSGNAFEAVCRNAGEAGEIIVRGRHVLDSYLNSADESLTKIRVENSVWHRTGDAGYLDRSGRLWLLGRCCARVEDDHGRTYPLEVEGCVQQMTEGCNAALFSKEGKRFLLVDRAGVSEVERFSPMLRRWHIDAIKIVKELPYDQRHRSKIDYAALQGTDIVT